MQALGEGNRWWNQRELRDLPGVLSADEQIIALAVGKVTRLRFMRRPWLIVVTDKRLLCLRSSARSGWRQFEVAAHQIQRLALRVGLFRGRILVDTGGPRYRLLLPKLDAFKVHASLSEIATSRQPRLPGFGPTRIARRIIDHVLALPAAAFDPTEPEAPPPPQVALLPAPDPQVEQLEQQVHQLQQQVEFLEELLRQRQAEQLTTGDSHD